MDFFQVGQKENRNGVVDVFPDFIVGRSKDIMVRGQSFYAIWNEEAGVWSTDEYVVPKLVDKIVYEAAEKLREQGVVVNVKSLRLYSSNLQNQFRKFMKNISDNSHQLDANIVFANTEVKKTDYSTRRLPYALSPGPHPAYDELVAKLYVPEELAKLEWAIGSIVAGDSKKIQKFIALYGRPGTGKGTILEIIKRLFDGYYAIFEAKALVGGDNFATEAFKDNPLIAIDDDAKMDKIEDNTKFNKITEHNELRLNEKYKPTYTTKINSFVFIGTNDPIKITDSMSGLIRRVIDVQPTGEKHDPSQYQRLMSLIDFELGAIAQHCLDVYRSMGKNYYSDYIPERMMLKTDPFYNFIEYNFDLFKSQDGTSLRQAYSLYKEYCDYTEVKFRVPMYKFREELRNYFHEFHDRIDVDGVPTRSYFQGFNAKRFKTVENPGTKKEKQLLVLEETSSILDEMYAGLPAQYSKDNDESPAKYWTNDERLIRGVLQKPKPSQVVSTQLGDLDTSRLHFLKVPECHIVIDFDLKDANGEKSLEANLEAAASWPATYAEVSKSGGGVHLHYIYDGGDPSTLAAEYSAGIEIKSYRGGASLRRKLTWCNDVAVATINSGLPFKKEKAVIETKQIQTEKGLRDMIARNLRKEIHPGTKPSIDFIEHILAKAYDDGLVYDVSDMRSKIMVFANNSSNQALNCLKAVKRMKFKSEVSAEDLPPVAPAKTSPVVFFDCEIYPNLFVICWKYEGSDTVVRMINPSPQDVEALFQFKLVGFNNRGYDNHILWGAFMGLSNQQLYELSQKIINSKENEGKFGEAYNLSYADVHDFASIKMSLKKWEIALGLHHMEMDLPWDKPVDPKDWPRVVEYCVNDVNALEALFADRKSDFVARQILADLSSMSVNDTTRKHAERIMFGNERNPQREFVYTDLSKEFPGYTFDPYNKLAKSTYNGEVVGEGGYVYAEPGIYEDVALLDIASMHPTSIEQLNVFGKFTEKFSQIKTARLAIKNGDFGRAEELLPSLRGLVSEENARDLEQALKLVINSIYGYTSATFPNSFRDPRNVDNIVAKRGALFMIDLKLWLMSKGIKVVHIKTDSVKIPGATPEIISMIKEFGKRYGYDFEHEATYKKMCLVNDAVYIARVGWTAKKGDVDYWSATGAQFQQPVVFKALFSGEPITFADLCETKSVTQGAMYLDFDENEATPNQPYKGMHFVGKTGLFLPVIKTAGGGKLVRVKDDKSYAVTGTKDYYWLEADMPEVARLANYIQSDPKLYKDLTDEINENGDVLGVVDMSYYEEQIINAMDTIEKFGSYAEFVK
jgi:hypothetical protein